MFWTIDDHYLNGAFKTKSQLESACQSRGSPPTGVAALELEIGQQIYALRGLPPEEIKMVEEGASR